MAELFGIDTDCATLALFHPDDLAHRAADPLAWYVDDDAYRAESAAGRLVAFITGADGFFNVRLTTTVGLTPQEADFECTPWAFPLIVRHGRVLLDNTDVLPNDAWDPEPDNLIWFDLANGAYRVTVHPIARAEASYEQAHALPDYVITFESIPDIAAITVVDGPPDLRPERNWRPATIKRAWENSYLWAKPRLSTTRFPALHIPDSMAVLPRQPTPWLPLDANVGAAVHRVREHDPFPIYAVAPAFRAGDLVALAKQTHGSTAAWPADAKIGLTLTGEGIATVITEPGPEPLAAVDVQLIDMPDMSAPPDPVKALRRQVLERSRTDDTFLSHSERRDHILDSLAKLQSPEAVTTWMLWHLEMPFAMRMSCYASPLAQRLTTLEAFL
jgi:hypothetical protein